MARTLGRLVGLIALSVLALQLFFAARIAAMRWVDPQSTAFQRSELWRLATAPAALRWRQAWVRSAAISPQLGRAVIASEDAGFTSHHGIEWDAVEKAWGRNQRAEMRAESRAAGQSGGRTPLPKLVGGSTITQQLAKNLFLSGERALPRKAQEVVIACLLEGLLGKQRILEIYLNSVEWGEGVFGAEAAARRYFGVGAGQLSAHQAARLAVMLPAPKRFEKNPASGYVAGRAATVAARMGDVELP